MNFTFKEWADICSSLDPRKCFTVSELLALDDSEQWISIKHDVETSVDKALVLARIEAEFSIRATYFVQSYLLKSNKEKLKKISELGHEVTYHYDVLDANAGNFYLAEKEFDETIEAFNALGFPVRTVCPHGTR